MSNDSKFLSRVLRHEPELLDIRLGREGWVLVDELLRKLKKRGVRKACWSAMRTFPTFAATAKLDWPESQHRHQGLKPDFGCMCEIQLGSS
jgi:hypothetical protein